MRDKRVFYSFTFYVKSTGKKLKSNCNTYNGARLYREEILQDDRYCKVSDIFEDRLD